MSERYPGTRLGLWVLRQLHRLPRPATAMLCRYLGDLYLLASAKRRRIARANLRLCFPEWGVRERRVCLRRHFRAATRCVFDYGLLWWRSEDEAARWVQVSGLEHLDRWIADRRPIIVLAGHFVALEMAAAVLSRGYKGLCMVKPTKNPVIDDLVTRGRRRPDGRNLVCRREDGFRPIVRAMRAGHIFYYLPDEDFGPEGSVFAPFLGTRAATLMSLARLATLTRAVVIPCYARLMPDGVHYAAGLRPALTDFPSGNDEADAARMNAIIGDEISLAPEQYLWTFKWFKTRPPGEASPYGGG